MIQTQKNVNRFFFTLFQCFLSSCLSSSLRLFGDKHSNDRRGKKDIYCAKLLSAWKMVVEFWQAHRTNKTASIDSSIDLVGCSLRSRSLASYAEALTHTPSCNAMYMDDSYALIPWHLSPLPATSLLSSPLSIKLLFFAHHKKPNDKYFRWLFVPLIYELCHL